MHINTILLTLYFSRRLNDMNPMMFGDTIRLPVFKPEFREMQE